MKHVATAWGYGSDPVKAPYQYLACGLDNIYLVSGYDVEMDEDGETYVTIQDQDSLHEAIGRYLVGQKKILSGKELRFLRLEMDLTQSELGRLIGYNSQQVARWEKDQNRITGPADRILRMMFKEHLGGEVKIRELLDEVDQMEGSDAQMTLFEPQEFGWRCAA